MQTPPLTFPLRPLKSPKAKQHKSAQLLSLEKNENPTKTRLSRFSGGYFCIQISSASSAKKPSWSSLFQRLPTAPIGLALGWPIRKQHFAKDTGFCSFNRLVRELRALTNEILLPEQRHELQILLQKELERLRSAQTPALQTSAASGGTSGRTRLQCVGRTRLAYHPLHAVSGPPSTCVSVDSQVYRQESGHAAPDMQLPHGPKEFNRVMQENVKISQQRDSLARELNVSLQKVSELESRIRNTTNSSSQATAGGGQRSSFQAAVELDPSRAALENNALSHQNDELQVKPDELVSLVASVFEKITCAVFKILLGCIRV